MRPGATCPWATAAPSGLCDAAEEWGILLLPGVFARAHEGERHDNGDGRCRVCGGPLDLDAWLAAHDG